MNFFINTTFFTFTVSCAQDYDVVFILDRSRRIGHRRFNRYKKTINRIIGELDFGKITTWISLVAFDRNAQVLKYLNDNNNAQFVKDFVLRGIERSTERRRHGKCDFWYF